MDSDLETPGAVELTRRLFASANSGDFDAMMSFFGPDSVWDVEPWALGAHAGIGPIRRFLEAWIGSFDEYRVVIETLLELDDDVVLVTATQYAHAARSPSRLVLPYAPLVVWQSDGLLARVTHYRTASDARAAATLLVESKR